MIEETTDTALRRTSYGHVRDLVEQVGHPYLFVEHTVEPHKTAPFRCHPADHRSFLVIEGYVEPEFPLDTGGADPQRYGYLEGWHALRGSVYRLRNPGGQPAVLLEAGSARGDTREMNEAQANAEAARDRSVFDGFRPVDRYTVTKPWGFEIWYTQNLSDPPYAMKQIRMAAGHQSSLQSHRRKAETNYVIEGEATVLNGVTAPDDLDSVIEVGRLPVSVHGPRSGWSSAPRVLHRVIARCDYTSIEVSTPELDDVIRWQDDTGRRHGRIDSEHGMGRR
jgi:mannose-6-phosphate isomerase-like protein (cupin superfamily)